MRVHSPIINIELENGMIGTLLMNEIPLLDKRINSYNAVTSDGKYIFIVSATDKMLSVYDFGFNFIKYIPLINSYVDICYDYVDKCFWAVANTNKVYKLDYDSFCEIDCVNMNLSINYKIVNIEFDGRCNGFVIVVSDVAMVRCNKQGKITEEYYLDKKESVKGLAMIGEEILAVSFYPDVHLSLIKVFDSDYSAEHVSCLQKNYSCKSMFTYHCKSENYFFVLGKKHNQYGYVIRYKLIYKK